MNILDNYLESNELNFRVVRVRESRTIRREETHTLLDRTIPIREFENMICVSTAAASSVRSHCRTVIGKMEEPAYIIEEEMKTDFYVWIRNTDKLLLDRKCKP